MERVALLRSFSFSLSVPGKAHTAPCYRFARSRLFQSKSGRFLNGEKKKLSSSTLSGVRRVAPWEAVGLLRGGFYSQSQRAVSVSPRAVVTSPPAPPSDASPDVVSRLGFEKIEEQFIKEYNSTAVLYKHKKTGAEVMSVSNNDENKVFGIVFRTPPDLAEVERASSIEKFRQLVNDWSLMHEAEPEGFHEEVKKQNSHILVVTDSCLPMQALGEAPLSAQVLINYDLPAKKEAYLRRLAACTSGIPFPVTSKVYGAMIPGMTTATINQCLGAIVINMVVGGEIVKLKNIEEGCGIVIEEMPINISELL